MYTRCYADLAQELTEAGYSDAEAKAISDEVALFTDIRAAIKKHSGEELDIKPYEADMRHLINTYIHADPASELGELGEMSLTELIIQTGIHDAIARKLNAKPMVTLGHRRLTLTVRPGTDAEKRAEVMHEWHKSLLHAVLPGLIAKWEPILGVNVKGYFLQRMKTKWGSCNHVAGRIRLNTELVKKPKDLLEYVVLHEMAHLIEPTHSERFVGILEEHYPGWREARAELNALPLATETWN